MTSNPWPTTSRNSKAIESATVATLLPTRALTDRLKERPLETQELGGLRSPLASFVNRTRGHTTITVTQRLAGFTRPPGQESLVRHTAWALDEPAAWPTGAPSSSAERACSSAEWPAAASHPVTSRQSCVSGISPIGIPRWGAAAYFRGRTALSVALVEPGAVPTTELTLPVVPRKLAHPAERRVISPAEVFILDRRSARVEKCFVWDGALRLR